MKTIKLKEEFGSNYLQNKDIAKSLREKVVMPTLKRGNKLTLDFDNVDFATQSCLHALFSYALHHGEKNVIKNIIFKNVKEKELKDIIKTVVEYSLS